jgi:hypothetical protein
MQQLLVYLFSQTLEFLNQCISKNRLQIETTKEDLFSIFVDKCGRYLENPDAQLNTADITTLLEAYDTIKKTNTRENK